MPNYSLHINSDCSLLIEFEDNIGLELSRFILGAKLSIETAKLQGFVEAVPAYNSLLLIFEPENFQVQKRIEDIQAILNTAKAITDNQGKQHEIPVCYDEPLAPDLNYVAEHTDMSPNEVIKLHSKAEYPVYMLGFLPGFLYLGNLDKSLHCPRRENPRPRIEAGSVAIGGDQTGIYPIDSPGGWHIIGKTPKPMLDITKQCPAIAQPLDTIKFKPISLDEFNHYER